MKFVSAISIAVMTSAPMAALAPAALAGAPPSSPDARAEQTLKQLTLDERFDLIRGWLPFQLPPAEQPKGFMNALRSKTVVK